MIEKLLNALDKLLDMVITWIIITGIFSVVFMGLKGLIVVLRLLL